MEKKWFVNVKINTQFLEKLEGQSTWKKPIDAGVNWSNNLQILAVSDDPADGIVVGTHANLTLNAGKDDTLTIRWLISEVNPLFLDYRGVVMYNFSKKDEPTTPIITITPKDNAAAQVGCTAILNGFNAESEPQDTYLKCTQTGISIPQTTVRANAKTSNLTYNMKLLLVNIEDINNPKVLKHIQVSLRINIKISKDR